MTPSHKLPNESSTPKIPKVIPTKYRGDQVILTVTSKTLKIKRKGYETLEYPAELLAGFSRNDIERESKIILKLLDSGYRMEDIIDETLIDTDLAKEIRSIIQTS